MPDKKGLSAINAGSFNETYSKYAKKYKMNPNPDDPRHFYDYRKLHKDTGKIQPNSTGHLPSKYKKEGHPRLFLDGVNTKTGKKVK